MNILLGILKSIIDFILSYWKQIAIVILIAIAIYQVYGYGYQKAYLERTAYYEKIATENHNKVITKIDSIEKLANLINNNTVHGQVLLNQDLNNIVDAVKKKKFTVINESGECLPSPEFIDAYNAIVVRGNQK